MIAAISFAVHPVSASLRAAALLKPCVTYRFGSPALAIFTAMNPLPKLFDVKGVSEAVEGLAGNIGGKVASILHSDPNPLTRD